MLHLIKKCVKFSQKAPGKMKNEEKLGKILREKQLKIAAAESLTGGLFCKRITDIPGSSKYFLGGIISYSYFAKEHILKVPHNIIDKFGAVSKETALSMAENAKLLFNSDIAISFTGVAGPEKQENKDVGTVFIGIIINNMKEVEEKYFQGSRSEIREEAVNFGIKKIIKLLGG